MNEERDLIAVVKRASLGLDRGIALLCALLFGSMTFFVLLGVFFRYILNSPLSWPEELSRYLMIWGASVAISLGIKADEHVGLTVLFDTLKPRPLRILLRTIIYLLVLFFLGSLFIYSIQMVKDAQYMQTLSLRITMVLPYAAIPVAMLIAAIQLILVFVIRTAGGDSPHTDTRIIDI